MRYAIYVTFDHSMVGHVIAWNARTFDDSLRYGINRARFCMLVSVYFNLAVV